MNKLVKKLLDRVHKRKTIQLTVKFKQNWGVFDILKGGWEFKKGQVIEMDAARVQGLLDLGVVEQENNDVGVMNFLLNADEGRLLQHRRNDPQGYFRW